MVSLAGVVLYLGPFNYTAYTVAQIRFDRVVYTKLDSSCLRGCEGDESCGNEPSKEAANPDRAETGWQVQERRSHAISFPRVICPRTLSACTEPVNVSVG